MEAAGRELSEAHVIETLRQKSAYRYRNVQQLRLLVWLLECGLAGLLGALFLLAGRRARAAVGTDSLGKKDCSIHKEGRRKKERPWYPP